MLPLIRLRPLARQIGLGSLLAEPMAELMLGLLLTGLLLFWPAGSAAWADAEPSCSGLSGDRRLGQPLCIEYLGEVILPSQEMDGTTLGGLSALAYDRQDDRLYALSDDHGSGQARLYQLALAIEETGDGPRLAEVSVTGVTTLRDPQGQPYSGSFDPEGLALTPWGSLFVSTEGNPAQGLGPGIFEFDRETGLELRSLPIPPKFTPEFTAPEPDSGETPRQIRGVQPNQGFESLSLSPTGTAPGDPLRLFVATEGPLIQDSTAASLNGTPRDRLLHYYLGEGPPLLLAEHLYPLKPLPGALFHGLSEILAIDGEGHFLSLERALTPVGFDAKLFQISLAGASDISSLPSLRGNLRGIEPIQKQLLLDLRALGIGLDNLEGMAWGPRLADGSRSLLLISDDNFKSFQKTQLLLFRVEQGRA